MPGTSVSDGDNVYELTTGATLNAAGTDEGDAFAVWRPGYITVELASGAVTTGANDGVFDVVIQASDSSTFASGNEEIGAFRTLSGTDAANSSKTNRIDVYCDKRYVRAVFTVAGTTPDFEAASVKVFPRHWQRGDATNSI